MQIKIHCTILIAFLSHNIFKITPLELVDKMLAINNQPEDAFQLRRNNRLQSCQNIRSAFEKMRP